MPYAELHAKTNFSFLEGASHPEEIVRRAAELGYAAVAVTDRNSLAGVVRAHGAAKEAGVKLLVGAEVTPEDAPPAVLLAMDRRGYGRLARLLTVGRRRAKKGECRLTMADVAEHAEGLIACVVGDARRVGQGREGSWWDCASRADSISKPPAGNTPPQATEVPPKARLACHHPTTQANSNSTPHAGNTQAPATEGPPGPRLACHHPTFLEALLAYREAFPGRCYLLAELDRGPDDCGRLARLEEWARAAGVPLAAAGGARFHVPERKPLCDVLTAIRLGCTVAEAGESLLPNAERYLKSPAAMAGLFAASPDAVRRTLEVAERCNFSLDELRYEYPEELAPPGMSPMQYLRKLSTEGARQRYPAGVPEKVHRLLEHELALIEELRYEAYFLTVWDLVRFARERGILCQGRGSAANSVVCYCLGVTSVDPERMDVLFERFISRERNEAPDIDVDFEHERREEVLQYLYEKYGRDRAGMTAEVITYRPRSAVREVGKALGLSLDRVDRLAKQVEHFHEEPDLDRRCREAGIDPDSTVGRQLIELVGELVGFPRHLSQHTGGMVMTRGPLCELVPIENAAMPDRTVIQWNKDDLDELGILKVDCLALGMLTAIRKCLDLVQEHTGRQLTLATIPPEDEETYAMIRRADTIGVFQIESRAQMSMLPRLKPRCFYDLVIEVAIVRPGPIQGDMVHPYLRRRNGEEPVEYPNEAVRQVLEKTLGVPLFQEQAMRLAMVAAGFTPGEADRLRRAMGAWRRQGVIDEFRQRLIDGMTRNGFTPEYAEAVFRQIRGFGEYGFPESHAASFALLVYASAWLKRHYPAAFTAALLSSQPMGFYAPAQLVRDARQHGVEVRPVDVNFSRWECTLEPAGDCPDFRGREVNMPDARHPKAAKMGLSPSGVPVGWVVPAVSAAGFTHAAETSDSTGSDEAAAAARTVFSNARKGDSPIFAAEESCDEAALPCVPQKSGQSPATGPALRLGFLMLRGMHQAHAEQITEARGDRPFGSIDEFTRRTGLGRAVVARLAKAGAFDSLTFSRRESLWHALDQGGGELPLFGHTEQQQEPDAGPPPLPALSPMEEVLADYRTQGLSLRGHPIGFLRQRLDAAGVVPAERLATWPNGTKVSVAGIVLVRQRPSTAKGITFVTLEDETGQANLIVRPGVWKRFRQAALGAAVLLATGTLQREGAVIHVVAQRLENLSERLGDLGPQSRDFC
ncbi:MAG: error-prone DNA polymerase [Thermoguttaceae bacterium]|jgi:error-prone DNA polymerase|nr:error-prone DNA polymerase [Thermoguttaceae bacterium]